MPAPSTAVAPSKRVLVDKFAEMALFDAAENQRVIVEGQKREAASKVQMRKALDEQVRLKQETIIRERDADKEWVGKEQERIKIWNEEEKKKIAEQRAKEETVREQREKQLRELHVMRQREREEQLQYETDILRNIHKEMKQERALELAKKAADADNLRMVAKQNEAHLEHLRQLKLQEAGKVRALEAEWAETLNKQERQRERQLKQTYARQARQYAASEAYANEAMARAAEDEARAIVRMKEDEEKAKHRESAARTRRVALRQECMDVLAIQVREKQVRAQADREREGMVVAREAQDVQAAESADVRRKKDLRERNMQYARELSQQMHIQETRKIIEPYLMSRPERQMNAALLKKLDNPS